MTSCFLYVIVFEAHQLVLDVLGLSLSSRCISAFTVSCVCEMKSFANYEIAMQNFITPDKLTPVEMS